MAYSKASSDRSPVRHDYFSLFGGASIRDTLGETQTVSLTASGDAIFTDEAGNYRVVYKAVSSEYSGLGDRGIAVRSAYLAEFNVDGDSSSNDYMLDWTNSRFNSISLDYYDSDSAKWLTSYKYAMTEGPDYALPNRSTSDTRVLDSIKNSINSNANASYNADFYANWEYQCALYNWQYPEGGSYIQYLFGNDNLNGTRLNDVITGGAGNDTVNGGNGDDVIYGSFGADTLYGGAGNDTIIFDGGSSVWDYKAGANTARGAYNRYTIDVASGGTGKDYFVLDLPAFNFVADQSYYPALPDLYGGTSGGVTNYNPFLSQSQNSTPFSTAAGTYGVSPLTMRTRIIDFKVGEDKLDLTNYGLDVDFINLKGLSKLTGAAFITAANTVLKPDGYALLIGKSASTSGNTTLFVTEAGVDTNLNGKTTDTLLEIQLVGLATSSISMKIFGDAPVI